jgi:hypothetical protein
MKGYFRNFNNNYYKYKNSNNYHKNKLDKNYKKENFIKFKNNEEKLKHISTIIENNNQTISNIIPCNETTYFTTYKNEYYFRTIGQQTNTEKGNFPENVIIKKAIFSNNKIIMLAEHNDINGNNDKLNVYYLIVITKDNNQFQTFSCKINNEPYDMIEDSNYIIISGDNIIDIFYFDQNNKDQITQVTEIIFNQNKENNNNDMYKALCIEETDQNIICGHSLGYVSKWVRIQNSPFLENVKISRIHFSSINKILYDTNSDNLKVIISCSSDKTLKIHSLDDLICIKVLNFNEEVIDIKKITNLKNQTNYFVNLKKGNLMLYDSTFNNILLDIYNNSQINRNFVCLTNYNNNNNNINVGNNNNNDKKIYVLITAENKIQIYEWIKIDKFQKNNN